LNRSRLKRLNAAAGYSIRVDIGLLFGSDRIDRAIAAIVG